MLWRIVLVSVVALSVFTSATSAEKYRGVSPKTPELPEHIAKIDRSSFDKPTAVWFGYDAAGKRFFLLFSEEPTSNEPTMEAKTSAIVFPGAASILRNTRRRIDTSYFEIPVNEAKVSQTKDDLVLQFSFRERASALSIASESGPGGWRFVFLRP